MKLKSKYFDSIRVGPKRVAEEGAHDDLPNCQWKGCNHPGTHRAPKGRGRDGEYFVFCVDHVRQYNASYNYFDGMSDSEVEDFQKDALTGHRPTWKVGANAWAHGTRQGSATNRASRPPPAAHRTRTGSLHGAPSRLARNQRRIRRQLRPLERKSLEALNLTAAANKVEIKTRFKELVKLHHPDANGGDNRSEDKLREIIQAYNYLKQAGLV